MGQKKNLSFLQEKKKSFNFAAVRCCKSCVLQHTYLILPYSEKKLSDIQTTGRTGKLAKLHWLPVYNSSSPSHTKNAHCIYAERFKWNNEATIQLTCC